jgi:beta-glucosidase
MIKGIEKDGKVGASAKHFAGYGQSNNGMDRASADISERDLREVHLQPFKEAIKHNVKTIMVNGSDVNGIPVPANTYLLEDVLRKELGFKGITLSDWEDIERLYTNHHIVPSKRDAIKRAFNAGTDINMANTDLEAVDILEDLVLKNEITIDKLNETVKRILETKQALGLFNPKPVINEDLQTIQNNSKTIAKQIAEESITLLKNENNILPLKKGLKNILVVGETANTKRHICGGWTLNWASANEEDLDFKTILEVLKEKMPNTNITYAKDIETLSKIVHTNQTFDLCINVVGEEPHSEWLGDTEDLKIEPQEAALLEASLKLEMPHIMVSLIGRPMDITEYEPGLNAILWAYLPGSEGTYPIVDILLGNISPSGKTPITYPLHVGQVPIYYNLRRYKTETTSTTYQPLYPFGHGLSYTTFEYSNLVISNEDILKVNVTITNKGAMKAKETILLYIVDGCTTVTRPVQSLKGFKKIELDINESKTITFELIKNDLSYYDEDYQFVFEPRTIKIRIADLEKSIKLTKRA